MPLKGTVQLFWHSMWKYLTVTGLICDTKPLLGHLTDRDLLIAWTIRSSNFFHLKTPIRWLSKSVNKKSRLQAVLKHCINFSDLEHIPLCDIYSLKFSLGVWSWELFLYKKQNTIFFFGKEFLSIGVRCSAEEASVWLPETWTYLSLNSPMNAVKKYLNCSLKKWNHIICGYSGCINHHILRKLIWWDSF